MSQGSVATRLRCGGIFNNGFTANFIDCTNERIFKIGEYLLLKVWTRVWCLLGSFSSGRSWLEATPTEGLT